MSRQRIQIGSCYVEVDTWAEGPGVFGAQASASLTPDGCNWSLGEGKADTAEDAAVLAIIEAIATRKRESARWAALRAREEGEGNG